MNDLTKHTGHSKGCPNPISQRIQYTMREVFEKVFAAYQDDPELQYASLHNWGLRNLTDFYKLSARLIPADVQISGNMVLNVVTGVPPRIIDHEGAKNVDPEKIKQTFAQSRLPMEQLVKQAQDKIFIDITDEDEVEELG
jgi:hypothetical protein